MAWQRLAPVVHIRLSAFSCGLLGGQEILITEQYAGCRRMPRIMLSSHPPKIRCRGFLFCTLKNAGFFRRGEFGMFDSSSAATLKRLQGKKDQRWRRQRRSQRVFLHYASQRIVERSGTVLHYKVIVSSSSTNGYRGIRKLQAR